MGSSSSPRSCSGQAQAAAERNLLEGDVPYVPPAADTRSPDRTAKCQRLALVNSSANHRAIQCHCRPSRFERVVTRRACWGAVLSNFEIPPQLESCDA